MEYRRLGGSGLKVSTLSLGSWVTFKNQVDTKQAIDMMSLAYEHGVNFFDNAEVYAAGQSEVIMGEALQELKWSRDSYTISSKVFWGGDKPTQRGLSRKHVHDACHGALKRLQVDYLDLFFCHRPDGQTPIEETVRAMDTLIQQGKVLYWGTSEWSAQQIMEAYSIARQFNLTPPTMEQPQYNMLHRDRVEEEYRRLYSEIGLGTTIWSPLASGLLTGKYNDGIPEGSRFSLKGFEWLKDMHESEEGQKKLTIVKNLADFCKKEDMAMTQLAIAWCAANPNVSTVILGASSTKQLKDNLEAIKLLERLDESMMTKLDQLLGNKPPAPPEY
ncbi:potassium channel beta subunit family protein [Pseudobacteriovorax antillogorgiicola]|uniref:Voltage-dependent potassium channel beta subunit, animal n=1 Tax=Pseudobacteriovorax antillogorgiicola TaxID=1513793 RepID=A0A1Y6BMR8_9BACT|nr:aldo/keto reductase [Pseudobacteriovorax antillogorgiicola]TCS55566.1 voltage-dependent potassium channel beta subunit [Pseudobacteriovorax antillogorgiicola]SMF10868.1 voltage-dependent potassium channel beta subunit, animal [Pseudobacteriovorax antillogorgiicola]